MNKLSLVSGLTISIAAFLLILNAMPNVAKAYSCSSSTSTVRGSSGSSSVSGSSGSCATAADSSSHTRASGNNQGSGSPPNAQDGGSSIGSFPASSTSLSIGGDQSSCVGFSANHNTEGNGGFSSQPQGGCSVHTR